MQTIAIDEITRENWREALRLAVRPEQQRFIADHAPIAAMVLAKAYVRPGGLLWRPLAFSLDGAMIGLAALACAPHSTEDYWIYHFFIDEASQGQGHGKRALRQLVDLVARDYPRCHQLQLTVHLDNRRAQALYTSLGFRPTGRELHGEPVYALDLSTDVLG